MLVRLLHTGSVAAVGLRVQRLECVIPVDLFQHCIRVLRNHRHHQRGISVQEPAVIGILEQPVDRLQIRNIFQGDMLQDILAVRIVARCRDNPVKTVHGKLDGRIDINADV